MLIKGFFKVSIKMINATKDIMKTKINETLAETQNITDRQRKNLDNLYIQLDTLLQSAPSRTDKANILKELTELEFQLQENWNFPKNINHHKYQYFLEDCECPIIDNLERLGTPYKIANQKCPYHGDVENASENG